MRNIFLAVATLGAIGLSLAASGSAFANDAHKAKAKAPAATATTQTRTFALFGAPLVAVPNASTAQVPADPGHFSYRVFPGSDDKNYDGSPL